MKIKLPKVSTKPYSLTGSKEQVLLLHGYTGTPYDLKPLALYLNKLDMQVDVPLLKGHGQKDPKVLNNILAKDWLKQAKLELNKFDQKRPIFVGGLSVGALIASILAGKYSFIHGIILLSPAFYFTWTGSAIIELTKSLPLTKNISLPKLGGKSDIADPKAKEICPSYQELPLKGLLETEKLRQEAIFAIKHISCPVFAGFGSKDGTIDVEKSKNLILSCPSQKIISREYKTAKHILPLDFERDNLCKDVENFLTSLKE